MGRGRPAAEAITLGLRDRCARERGWEARHAMHSKKRGHRSSAPTTLTTLPAAPVAAVSTEKQDVAERYFRGGVMMTMPASAKIIAAESRQ